MDDDEKGMMKSPKAQKKEDAQKNNMLCLRDKSFRIQVMMKDPMMNVLYEVTPWYSKQSFIVFLTT